MTREQKIEFLKNIQQGQAPAIAAKGKPDFSKLTNMELKAVIQYARYNGNTNIMIDEIKEALLPALSYINGETTRDKKPIELELPWDVKFQMDQRVRQKEEEAIASGFNIRRTR